MTNPPPLPDAQVAALAAGPIEWDTDGLCTRSGHFRDYIEPDMVQALALEVQHTRARMRELEAVIAKVEDYCEFRAKHSLTAGHVLDILKRGADA